MATKVQTKTKTDAAVREYTEKVSENLVCSKTARAFFMRELKTNLSGFISEREDAGYEDLVAEFGEPEIFGGEFAQRDDYAELLKKAQRKAAFWKCVGVALILVTIAVVVLCILYVHAVTGEYLPRRPIF
ncbi:MAG: hypothetical protein IJV00_04230 [Clostridia bacterium]|nr:hypothetical protein [Clostridia bacterium]